MDLQKKWDGVWKMKFIQQYKNLSKEIYILLGILYGKNLKELLVNLNSF